MTDHMVFKRILRFKTSRSFTVIGPKDAVMSWGWTR